ncbi:MAG: ABC transporter permease [Armatimonadetes bacterium]|nr:ABC transporter permease [Armatimonadota bacterium]
MARQIRFELFKIAKRPRSYLGFAAFALINFFTLLGVKYGGIGHMAASQASGRGFEVIGSPVNAELMAWTAIGSPMAIPILSMFLPFFIALVFGEIFAGESAEGTLRTLLTRPITRSSLLTAKFAASVIYAFALVGFVGVSAYIMGSIAFGRGGLMTVGKFDDPMIAYYPQGQALIRLALAYMLTGIGMTALGMIAFFISTWLNNSLGAIGGAVMLLFAMFIVGEIPYFHSIKDYLLSTNLLVGQNAFLDPIPWNEIRASVVYLGVYIAVLFSASMLTFRGKDILA